MLTVLLAALTGTPIVHPLSWDSLARFEGWRLAGARVTAFARSEVTQGEQLLELTVEGRARWAVRCLQRAGGHRTTLACGLTPDGAVQAAHFVSLIGADGQPWQGYRIEPGRAGGPGAGGWAPGAVRAVIGVGADEAGAVDGTSHYTYGLKFPDAQGHPTAHYLLGQPPKLTVPDGMAADEVELLAVTALTVEIAGDLRPEPGVMGSRVGTFLDGYPLVEVQGQPLGAPAPGPDRALAAVSAPHAAVMADFAARSPRLQLDRAAGPRVKREGDLGRVVMELSGGAVSAPGVDGAAPGGVDGFQLRVGGGIRLAARTSVLFGIGVEVGLLDGDGLRALPGAIDASSGGASLALHLRHAVDLGWGVEPVVGLQVRGRLRSVEVEWRSRSDELQTPPTSEWQFGVGLAPTIGLQRPWTLNDLDTRLAFFLEVAPEWTAWTTPEADPQAEPRTLALGRALRADDTQITTTLGVRFEL